MKSFNFRYNNILLLLEKKENSIRNNLNSAKNDLFLERKQLEKLIDNESDYSNMLKERLEFGCKLDQVRNIDDYKKQIKNMILNQYKKIKNIEDRISLIKKDLIEVSREKKVMEKLKDRDFEQYMIEFKLAEEKMIDQIVTYSNSLSR